MQASIKGYQMNNSHLSDKERKLLKEQGFYSSSETYTYAYSLIKKDMEFAAKLFNSAGKHKEKPVEKTPAIVERILNYAGKTREQVSNPHITARETIVLANWMVENCKSLR